MTDQAIEIDSVTDLVLLLLLESVDVGRREMAGATRLQKLLFLLSRREDFGHLVASGKAPVVHFMPYRMGPFTPSVYEAVELLSTFDPPLVEVASPINSRADIELDQYVDEVDLDRSEPAVASAPRPTVYRLTEEGRTVARQLRDSAPRELRRAINETVGRWSGLPLRQLLRQVYSDYPEYTAKSEIKEELGLG